MNVNLNQKAYALGSKASTIREIFEYSKKRKAEIGADKVFDFSIGNPSVEPPKLVEETLKQLVAEKGVHGYTSAKGDLDVREKIANSLKPYDPLITLDNIFMTVGAAASLTSTLNGIVAKPTDEIIVICPFFTEYKVFIESAGGIVVKVESEKDTFDLDIANIEKAITKNTAGIIINSPNNPSGVVYGKEKLAELSRLLERKSIENDRVIYLVSDEPYREILFEGREYQSIFSHYDNSIICYSYSKSLSLAGERIGYVAVSSKALEWQKVMLGVMGAARSLGYVCAPSIFQKLINRIEGTTVDISIYEENSKLIYETLKGMGYEVVKPQGAFYLFLKAIGNSAAEFCEKAKAFELLFVPSDDFGTSGYVRIAFCKDKKEIEASFDAFQKLIDSLK